MVEKGCCRQFLTAQEAKSGWKFCPLGDVVGRVVRHVTDVLNYPKLLKILPVSRTYDVKELDRVSNMQALFANLWSILFYERHREL